MLGRAGVRFAPAIVLLLLVALPAHAALFDDDEARKRIDALKLRVDQLEHSLSARLDTLEATVKNQALVDMFKDVEQIKADLAKLRGQNEVLTYELEQAQKRQRDLYLDLDSRLRRLEGSPAADAGAGAGNADAAGPANATAATAAPAATATDIGAEQRAYDAALDQFKSGAYVGAYTSFQSFARTYPKSALAPSAMYWAGNAQYAQRDFRGAIAAQRQLLATYPDSQKVPDALLNIASSQLELGDAAGSRHTLEDIVAKYPTTEAGGKARQRLAASR